jgi:hypothetical protein
MPKDDEVDEAPQLILTVSFDVKSSLFIARLSNGTRFNFSPANVSGKLGQNLDLLKAFTQRNAKGEPPHPHVSVVKGDAKLIEEAIAAGKVQKVGVTEINLDLLD